MAVRYRALKFPATAESTSEIAACSEVTRTAAAVPSTRTPARATPAAPYVHSASNRAAARHDRRNPAGRVIARRSMVTVVMVLQLDVDARTMTDLRVHVTVRERDRLDRRGGRRGDQRIAVLRDHAGAGWDRVDRAGLALARTGREGLRLRARHHGGGPAPVGVHHVGELVAEIGAGGRRREMRKSARP